MFAIEPVADFSLFLGYCPSKNGFWDHDGKSEYVPFAKPIEFGSTGKKTPSHIFQCF